VSSRLLEVLGYSCRGGAASSLCELVPGLLRGGFEVTVAAPPEPRFAAAVTSAGARFVAVPMAGRGDWRSLARLIQLVRRGRFDVVHTHCRNADLHGGLAAKSCGVPLVVHLRGLLVDGGGATGGGLVDRFHRAFVARAADRIVAVSEAVRRRALSLLRVPPERVVTVRNGVDLDRFAAPREPARTRLREQLRIPENAPLLLAIGTLGRCKGQDVLLRALALLPESVHALLVGGADGHAREELERLVRSLGVGPRVRFLGPRDDVPELLATSDLLVQPSRWEGFGRAVAEAMAAGVAVVASDVDGLREIVEHDRTGLLVPPDRPELLARALARLLDRSSGRELRRRLADSARAFAREQLDVRDTAARVATLLREVAGSRRAVETEALAEARP